MPEPAGRPTRPLYVEIEIGAAVDVVWELTQQPHHHQRWDARFSRITYAEPPVTTPPAKWPSAATTPSPPPPVRFRYTLGARPGPVLSGSGITTAERRRPDGTRTSALRFSSDTRLSPLQEGAGYWRYLPVTAESVRFLTGYDYRTWSGPVGGWLDRWMVRPAVGWLTAWSFDRLRLWAERGISPERALLNAYTEVLVRLTVAAACVLFLAPPYGPVPGAAVGLAVLGFSLLVPPSAVTPAARRCTRHPRDRRTAHAPKTLGTLPSTVEKP
ncbi:hypothetical protein [Saccharothrix sp. ST-888]|uniref:hypothetical protein n=1 Tax=Saccharothrix sp. ST-888 TaxID=1427391 RepID=UPI0005EC2B41|nr:hypothetical protein [Saccharothrix sp. ST-888]KJK54855.1 hypothetical protein UK12_32395 [Saccharothrix sp. ST-888]